MDNRPLSIKRFEMLYYISLLIGVVTSAIMYESMLRQASPLFIGIVQFFTFASTALLIFLISRKRSKIAKWFLVGMWAIGLIFYIPQLSQMLHVGLAGVFSIIQLCLQAVGLYYLFTDEVKEWMDGKGKKALSLSEINSSQTNANNEKQAKDNLWAAFFVLVFVIFIVFVVRNT